MVLWVQDLCFNPANLCSNPQANMHVVTTSTPVFVFSRLLHSWKHATQTQGRVPLQSPLRCEGGVAGRLHPQPFPDLMRLGKRKGSLYVVNNWCS